MAHPITLDDRINQNCPHLDASTREYFDIQRSFGLCLDSGSNPTPEDDPTLLTKLQPGIDMMRGLLLESHLSADVIEKLMRMYVPKKHHHAIGPITKVTERRTFHPFPRLPAELRIIIWELAAERPARVLFWPDQYGGGGLPLNSPADIPLVARACKEAWDVVNAMGAYCDMRGARFDPPYPVTDPVPRVWAAAKDLVLVPFGVDTGPPVVKSRVRAYDFLRSRREVVVKYMDFILNCYYQNVYKKYTFLRDMDKLDTVVCVIAEPKVYIWTDKDNEDASPGLTNRQLRTRNLLQKLVLLEDAEEVEGVDAFWRAVEPEWRWLSRASIDLLRVNAPAYAPSTVSRCLDCEMRPWNREKVPRIREAWLRILCGDNPDITNDPAIFPKGFPSEPDIDHPWVQQSLARMPKIKPALLLTFKKRSPSYDERGRQVRPGDWQG